MRIPLQGGRGCEAACAVSRRGALRVAMAHADASSRLPPSLSSHLQAFLPVMESFGFETDLRYHTQVQYGSSSQLPGSAA